MKYALSCLFICCVQHAVMAQQYIKPTGTEIPEKSGVVQKSPPLYVTPAEANPVSADLNLLPILTKKRAWQPERGKNPEKLEAIKQEKALQKVAGRIEKKSQDPEGLSLVSPVLGRNFPGNGNDGSSPMDNMLAISNSGWIVTVVNSNIQYFSVGGQRFFSKGIADFFNFAGVEDVCDPLVLYDNEADRFIVFAQECSGESANSSLLIGFSKSNNPNQGWWTYNLSGNPRKNNTWFDYPKMAVTKNELLISGNSFEGDEFKEALLFQIQKAGGFAGEKLNYQYWYGFPGAPFTLLPVGYGLSGSYGPGAYLVASEPEGAKYVHLYDLTNDMSASDERIVYYKIPVEEYSPAANAAQKGTDRLLDNGDCRALSGFLLDTVIHMVFHTDQGDGWNGINYLRIHALTRKAEGSTFGLAGSYDYSYPAVASLAGASGDKSVAIGFSRSSEEIFPQIRVVTCDGNFNWSSSLLVKSGVDYVDYTAEGEDDVERWGDYSGIARWFGTPTPTVWLSASFGSLNNDWETWIAEVKRASAPTATVEPLVQEGSLRVFPNPGVDIFRTSFTLEKPAALRVALFGIQGNLEKILYEGKAASGEHYFTFNRAALVPGSYILTVFADGKPASSTQVIIGN
jgi:hypothetical protein